MPNIAYFQEKLFAMRFKYFKTAILMSMGVCNIYAQGDAVELPEAKTFLTISDNKEWMNEFERLTDKSVQVSYIKSKILADSQYTAENFVNKEDYWKNLVLTGDQAEEDGGNAKEAKANCDCKIKFKLVLETSEYDLDAAKFRFVNEILDSIEAYQIDAIRVNNKFVKDNNVAKAGECGSVLLYSEDRGLKRLMRRLLKE